MKLQSLQGKIIFRYINSYIKYVFVQLFFLVFCVAMMPAAEAAFPNCPGDTVNGWWDISNTQTINTSAIICEYINISSTGKLYANSSIGNFSVNITVGNLTIQAGGEINGTATGYLNATGPGAGSSPSSGSGGGHGGMGGAGAGAGLASNVYGNAFAPVTLGSGGGNGSLRGGAGGGAVIINVTNITWINGTIAMNGESIFSGAASGGGGGAGGSLYLDTDTLYGTGTLRAMGGFGRDTSTDGAYGGGGRIAVYYTTIGGGFSFNNTFVSSLAGSSTGSKGDPGTALFINKGTNNIDIVEGIDFQDINNPSFNFSTVTFWKSAFIRANASIEINATNFIVTGVSNFSCYNASYNITIRVLQDLNIDNLNLSRKNNYFRECGSITISRTEKRTGFIANQLTLQSHNETGIIVFNVTDDDLVLNKTIFYGNVNFTNIVNISLSSGSMLNASNRGRQNGTGEGAGGIGISTSAGAGGSYGGRGGYAEGGAAPSTQFGDPFAPREYGAPGGAGAAGANKGRNGGGLIYIIINGTFWNNGTILADGEESALLNDLGGSGSGGAIFINTTNYFGIGILLARGGIGYTGVDDHGAGGGGRIAVYYNNTNSEVQFNTTSVSSRQNTFQLATSGESGTAVFIDKDDNNLYIVGGLDFNLNGYNYSNVTIEHAMLRVNKSFELNTTSFVNTGSRISNMSCYNTSYNFIIRAAQTIGLDNLNISMQNSKFYAECGNITIHRTDVRTNYTANRLTLQSNGTINFNVTDDDLVLNKTLFHGNINLTNIVNISLSSGSMLNASNRGRQNGTGEGAGGIGASTSAGAGGSYGGRGGYAEGGAAPSAVFGDPFAPLQYGAPGGAGAAGTNKGRNGGGLIYITINGTFWNNGTILADGQESAATNDIGGSGSGGAIFINTTNYFGVGALLARGGISSVAVDDHGAGGGGRIAVYYNNTNSEVQFNTTSVSSRQNTFQLATSGESGTAVFIDKDDNNLYIVGGLDFNLNGYNYSNVTIEHAMLRANTSFELNTTSFVNTGSRISNMSCYNTSYNLIIRAAQTIGLDNFNSSMQNSKFYAECGNITIYRTDVRTNYTVNSLTLQSNGTINFNVTNDDLVLNKTLFHGNVNFTNIVNISLSSGGMLNASNRGRQNGTGEGAGGIGGNAGAGAGGSYGGRGGYADGGAGAAPGSPFGDPFAPLQYGAPGGAGSAGAMIGRNGGGLIYITINGTFWNNGSILADGEQSVTIDNRGGCGSGGAIFINTTNYFGIGTLLARGGIGSDDHGAGGGGRIAVYYNNTNSEVQFNTTSVSSRQNTFELGTSGESGTAVFIDKDDNNLYIVGGLDFNLNGYNYSNVTIEHAMLRANTSFEINTTSFVNTGNRISNMSCYNTSYNFIIRAAQTIGLDNFNISMQHFNNSMQNSKFYAECGNITIHRTDVRTNYTVNSLTLHSNGTINFNVTNDDLLLNATLFYGNMNLTVTNMTLYATSSLIANFLGSGNGSGPGTGVAGGGPGGAGYGGRGGNGTTSQGGSTYGSNLTPIETGSGGAGSVSQTPAKGGNGGGQIFLNVTNRFEFNGTINASGKNGSVVSGVTGAGGGGGSGGSIWIWTRTLNGNGKLAVHGGNGGDSSAITRDAGGGGGGRIAVYLRINETTTLETDVSGGKGNATNTTDQVGQLGTIVFISTADTTSPSPVNLRPIANTAASVNFTVNISATVTDNENVSLVLANVTYPDNTTKEQLVLQQVGNIYNFSFRNTSLEGHYNITFIANDTSNNINDTEKTNFTVDSTEPVVTNIRPLLWTNQTANTTLNISATATDEWLNVDAVLANVTYPNNTTKEQLRLQKVGNIYNFSFVNTTAEGVYTIVFIANDTANNINDTEKANYTIDGTIVNFNSLYNEPTSADDVDPTVRLAYFANITDNITQVNTVLLQYKLSTDSGFTNVTMIFNSSNGLYEAGFTPVTAGTYNVRLFANDTVNNQGQSSQVNIIVEYDYTWTRSPTSVAVGTTPNLTISFMNITLNNTGDFAQNFLMISTWQNTTFNTTFPLALAAEEIGIVEVRVTAPSSVGGNNFQIEINASPSGNPATRNITATLAVTEGQPFLAATITTLNDSIRITDTLNITARLQNIGTGNATTGTLFFTLPTGWNITSGNQTYGFSTLNVNEDINSTIQVEITSSASLGLQTVKVNATGLNTSGVDLATLNSISGTEQTVNVSAAPTPLGGERVPAGGAPGAGAAGASGSAAAVFVGQTKLRNSFSPSSLRAGIDKTLRTEETIYVVRGEYNQFPLTVLNIYNNSAMTRVNMSVKHYPLKYISWEPPLLTNLAYNESGEFLVTLHAPGYKEREEINLTLVILSDVVAQYIDFVYDPTRGLTDTVVTHVKTTVSEERSIHLIIIETSHAEAAEKVAYAENMLAQFADRKLGIQTLSELLDQIHDAYDAEEYATVEQLYQRIKVLGESGLEAYDLLTATKQRYTEAESLGYDTGDLGALITLAEQAMAREDYESALLRAKETLLYEIVVVEQQFNVQDFLLDNWILILASLLAFGAVLSVSYRQIFLITVDRRIVALEREDQELEHRKREAQDLCYGTKKISNLEYHKRMLMYMTRQDAIRKQVAQLREQKQVYLSREKALAVFKKEYKIILDKIKALQYTYFVEQKMPRNDFNEQLAVYHEQLAYTEEELGVLEALYEKEDRKIEEIKEKLRHTPFIVVLRSLLNKKNIRPSLRLVAEYFQYSWYTVKQMLRLEHAAFLRPVSLRIPKFATVFFILFSLFAGWFMITGISSITGHATTDIGKVANASLSDAEAVVLQMEELGLETSMLDSLVSELRIAVYREDYWEANRLSQEISKLSETALEAHSLITRAKAGYTRAQSLGYDTGQFGALITLSEHAMEREDYDSALLRAKEMELYGIIVVEQQFDLGAFIILHWKLLLVIMAVSIIIIHIAQRKIFLYTVDKKLARLVEEELKIEHEKENIQDQCFVKNKLSRLEYHKQMILLETRLMQNHTKQEALHHAKKTLLSKEVLEAIYSHEQKKILDKIKKLQESYFIYNKIPPKDFLISLAKYREQLTTVEEDLQFVRALHHEDQYKYRLYKERVQKINVFKLFRFLFKKDWKSFSLFVGDSVEYMWYLLKCVFHVDRWLPQFTVERKLIVHVLLFILVLSSLITFSVGSDRVFNQTVFAVAELHRIPFILHVSPRTAEQIEADNIATEQNRQLRFGNEIEEECPQPLSDVNNTYDSVKITLLLQTAQEDIIAMEENGLKTLYVTDLYMRMIDESAEDIVDYDELVSIGKEIHSIRAHAFYLQDLLQVKRVEIEEFSSVLNVNVSKAWDLYTQAEEELHAERYENAEQLLDSVTSTLNQIHIEATRLTTIIKAQKNRFIEWVLDNLLVFASLFILLSLIGYGVYKKGKVFYLHNKLDSLAVQKKVLEELIKKSQYQYFVENNASEPWFTTKVKKYKEDIEAITTAYDLTQDMLKEKLKKGYSPHTTAAISVLLLFIVIGSLVLLFGPETGVTGFAILGGGGIAHVEAPTESQLAQDAQLTELNRIDREEQYIQYHNKTNTCAARAAEEQHRRDEQVSLLLSDAENAILLMRTAGLGTAYIEELYAKMQDEASEKTVNIAVIEENRALITQAKDDVFYAVDMLMLKETEIHEFENVLSLNVSEVWDLYDKASQDIVHERYASARTAVDQITPALDHAQIEAARLTTLLKAQRNRFLEWLFRNVFVVGIVLAVFSIIGYILYRWSAVSLVARKMKFLEIQRQVLSELVKHSQYDYFVKKTISPALFLLKTDKYRDKIEKVNIALSLAKEDKKKHE